GKGGTLWAVVGFLLAAYVGGALLYFDNQVVQQRIIKMLEMGVMERLIRHILRLSVPFLNSQSPGDLIQAIRLDCTQLRLMIRSLATILLDGMLAVGLVVVAFWLSPWLAFWARCALPL